MQAVPAVQLTVTREPAAYPVPVNVTTVPTGADEGETVRAEVTPKVEVAVFLDASFAVNVWAPSTAAETWNAQEKLPDASVVALHAIPVAQVTFTSDAAANPMPVNVTVVPTGPEETLSPRDGTTTRVAIAVSASPSVAENTCGPATVAGRVYLA